MSLFHYTDLNAVVSILKNRTLWLTDLRYLNDRSELEHGIQKLNAYFREAPDGLFCNAEAAYQAREHLKSFLPDASGSHLSRNPIYVASLSKSENLLSQWRGYGSYAIEFDESRIINNDYNLLECIYDEKRKNDLAVYSLTHTITSMSNCIDVSGCMSAQGFDALSTLWKTAARFKDPGFAEEREFRFLMNEVDASKINYRVRGKLLIPYVELDISLDSIKAIHIGPMTQQLLAKESMQGFCDQIEKEWQFESGNTEYWLQVKCSEIPYREL